MFSWYVSPVIYEVYLPLLLIIPAVMALISLWDILRHHRR